MSDLDVEAVEKYQIEQTQKIISTREKFPLQPIVFVGSGLSRRWISAPTWFSLLDWAIEKCPEIDKPIQFFTQQEVGLPEVAERIATAYQSWAWGAGSAEFPPILFEVKVPADIYLKYAIAQHIKGFGTGIAEQYQDEASAFASIRPHAVITTNYDGVLEKTLPGYQPILGAGLISAPFAIIGEIYKIHGTVEKPSSMVLTSSDYLAFGAKRKYLTAKLLTFFAEHPILFVGYRVEDTNIRKILEDLDEAVEIKGGTIPNIFFLTRPNGETPAFEKILQVSADKGVRVNAIETKDFEWVFKAFGHNAPLSNVNPQVLRSLLARSYQLVRSDIPKQMFEVDFELIRNKVDTKEQFAKVFGIGTLQPVTGFSASYPYNLTEVGRKLGYATWHGADKLIKQIKNEKDVDIKASDNQYHGTVRISKKSKAQMYSEACVELLEAVRDGVGYEVHLV
ncbi:SIR2 family protein [Shimia abyssi]|uniref:SIR2-like protein n=1 Tax=Shimia abyssi TaxID=1662395 RepID=A0A2P8FGV3_9RHOB|nr:SIR2 family protein [Shimia abyssi]PSL20890.1 SIR2-like protein [Shimia abyssi]